MSNPSLKQCDRKLNAAVNATWLRCCQYPGRGCLNANISRQAAQRLAGLAVHKKLIKFRLDHSLKRCIALAKDWAIGLNFFGVKSHPAKGNWQYL
jgi:hypothetical protein